VTELAPAKAGAIESVSALGLLVGGGAGVLALAAALWFRLPPDAVSWWAWLLPLWVLGALPLGWALRSRSAPAKLRALGRVWLISAAVPLIAVLAFGKPVQKVMLEQQAAQPAQMKGN
jgi:hypothetical protein